MEMNWDNLVAFFLYMENKGEFVRQYATRTDPVGSNHLQIDVDFYRRQLEEFLATNQGGSHDDGK